MELFSIIAIVVSLILSAFFSGTEIAFVSANRLHIELQKRRAGFSGRILAHFVKNSSHFIATLLVGNTITLVVYGIFMANILDPMISDILPNALQSKVNVLIIQTILSTLLVLITAEFLPKSLFLISPNRVLSILSVPIAFFYYFLYPFVWLIVRASRFVFLHILRLDYSDNMPVFGLFDLNQYVNSFQIETQESTEKEIDTTIISKALSLKELKARECMIPRTDIVAIDLNDKIDKLRKTFTDSGHSKILIYEDSIDNIVGYCHTSGLFKNPQNISDIVSEIIIIPETTPAIEVLNEFISNHKSIALVVDEFGGTAGIVTMEDIMEEIVGEIEDEYDKSDELERKINENTFEFSTRHEINYLNEKYNLEIPEGEYDTLGGFILHFNEDIPKANERIQIPPFEIIILSTNGAKINTIRVHKFPDSYFQIQG